MEMRASPVAAVLLLAACPPDHSPGPRGEACGDISDCNERRCGDLVACVRGFCLVEAPRLVVPCQDAGPDGSRFECGLWRDCNPGRECGSDLVACVGGICDPTAPRVVIPCDAGPGVCVRDADCVVAFAYDRCCGPCATVLSRPEVAAEPCRYAADRIPAGRGSDECYPACKACTDCDPAPIAAECSGGTCLPIHGPCEPFSAGVETMPVGEAVARAPELLDQRITVWGVVRVGDATCTEVGCDPGPRCRTPLLLDGTVEVRGSSCGVLAECSDAACSDITCRPMAEGRACRVTGWWRGGPGSYILDLVSFEEM